MLSWNIRRGGVASVHVDGQCTPAHLDLWAFRDDVLRRLAGGDVDLDTLLSDAWAKRHPDKVRSHREAESLARAAKTKYRRRKLARK